MKLKTTLALFSTVLLLALATQVSLAEDAIPPKPDRQHRSEGEQYLGSMRDTARVNYSKNGKAAAKLSGKEGAGADADSLKGTYFTVTDRIYVVGDKGERAALTADPVKAADGFAIMIFKWASGDSEVSWYDTAEARKKGHDDVAWGEDEAEKEPEEAETPDAGKQWDELHKVGASWIYNFSGGMFQQKTEITEVKDGVAKTKLSMKMGAAWMDPTDGELKRPEKLPVEVKPDPKWTETGKGTDKVKVGELEIDVTWIEGTYDGKKVRNVVSTKYGIIVKSEYDGKVSLELTEFNPK